MKSLSTKTVLGFAFLLMSIFTFAQSAYEKAMGEKVNKVWQCKTPEEFTALSNEFTRIGDKEKTQWLPYYYAALTSIQKGRTMMREGKISELDAAADEAQKSLTKSVELNPENAENYILTKMIHSLRMMVNPQARFMTEGMAAAEALSKAENLDVENPRITLLKGEDTYFTPEQFGGSKVRGKELIAKSLEQFKVYKPKTALDPNWGQKEAEFMMTMN